MIQDVFVPSRVGSYYIFSKRVLAFEITTTSLQACLLYFFQNKIVVENSITINLQDQNPHGIINAIKKIASTIGKYDEVVTSLTSSAVIFKELVLPFIGREKIAMIINYEVEPLLPFPLEEAVIDFLITQEDKEKVQSTILVAATRKTDVETVTSYFEKAGVQLTHITLDMFALYDFYRHTMYVAQAHTSLMLVDFGIDAIRLLYIQKGVLQSVRLVPFGVSSMINKMNHTLENSSHRSLEDILHYNVHAHQQDDEHVLIAHIIENFCKQISLSLSFFQKQVKGFVEPARVICLGAGTQLPGFLDQATQICQIMFENLDMKRVAHRNNIQTQRKIKIEGFNCTSLIIALSSGHYGEINFLSHEQRKNHSTLLNKQLFFSFILSVISIVGLYVHSNFQVKKLTVAYNKSKKEMTTILQEQMNVDVKNIKRMSDVVQTAQDKLQQTKKVCFSFSQSNNAFLQHLQELFSAIDRDSLGLDLKKLSLQSKEVVLQGKVKDFEALGIFEEELIGLKSFTLKNIPGELNFNITLQVKDEKDMNKVQE